jgi:lantibiotic modifying enzyme
MSSQGFLASAHRLGRTLCREAVWAGPVCNWLGWTARPICGQMVIGRGSQSASFGFGTAGIGLFLAWLYAHTSDALIRTTSRAALQHAVTHANLSDPGIFTGYIGIACAAAEASELLDARQLKTHACRLFGKAMEALAANSAANQAASNGMNEDTMLRYAGSIPLLLAVGRRRQLKCAVELAVRMGEVLEESVSCATRAPIPQPKAAMIASALSELVAETGQETLKAASDRVLQESRYQIPLAPFWPSEDPSRFPDLYSEAASPISFLYARAVRAAQLHPDHAGFGKYADAVTEATSSSLMRPLVLGDGGYCLGHGVAGKAEVLMLAAHRKHDLFPIAAAAGQTGMTHFSEKRMPWPCAVPAGESPNLLFGLAGIGYFYLRLFDPAGVPSLLA